jgi:CheY-like chemotaxis protein
LVAVQQYFEAKSSYASTSSMGFDVIILDLDMPIMNGFEACKRICMGFGSEDLQQIIRIASRGLIPGEDDAKEEHADDLSPCSEKPYIIALSGLITDSVVDKGIECGFDNFSKPTIFILFS